MSDTIKIAVVYHSGYGHTKVQAEAVHAGADEGAGVNAALYAVDDLSDDLSELADADAMIFGSPTYMGNVSGPFKSFMDKSSRIWLNRGWSGKIAGGFTNSSSQLGDKGSTLQALSVFAIQHGMVWVGLDMLPGNNSTQGSDTALNRMGASLGAVAQSLADQGPDQSPPSADLETARAYGRNVALAARRWGKSDAQQEAA
ncbi:NADPH-dependent FMN reductase [Actibacterium mucosum KCTC 23349]|uniref:NADPH-dependent FMN reductase n=1 Tax=Actibacterium mucosum KCTC 23349 TaxID=1454373 RepID=A0A037ZRL9_9RHOB|nr:flavodoxin family protein [Actibacterium mucosum]KAJ57492.1 NADPH-dependent FMN reductase [Actibacterium mucosum KCTC 23349]